MRRTTLVLAILTGMAIPLTSVAAKPKVTTQALPGVNFSSYKTFAWASSAPPGGMNPVMFQQIMADIDAALAQKGYQKGEPGDMTLILTVGAQDKTDVTSWGRFGLQTSVYQYTQGQLSLDAFDTNSKQALWHGQATETVDPSKPKPSKIDAAVTQLMASFPPTGAAPAPSNP